MCNLQVNVKNMTICASLDSVDTAKWQNPERMYNCVWQMTWFAG